jgi:hypothetical protein
VKRARAFLIYLIVFSAATSCTLYRQIPIEVLRPREISIPQETGVALLYRNFKHTDDSLHLYYRDNSNLIKVDPNSMENCDSIISTNCLNKLGQYIESYDIADNIIQLSFNTLPRQYGEYLTPLPPEVIQTVGARNGAGMIISLESISYLFSQYSIVTDPEILCDVVMTTSWAVYASRTGTMIHRTTMEDTLLWYRTIDTGNGNHPPKRMTALKAAAEKSAARFANKFVTGWEEVQRTIIIPPLQEFKVAADYAFTHEWDKALKLWELYTPDRFGRLAVSARFNAALAREMSDDIEGALHWIGLAQNLAALYKNKYEMEIVRAYSSVLSSRNADIQLLRNQQKQP